MKNKKFIGLFIFIFALTMTACNTDEDNNGNGSEDVSGNEGSTSSPVSLTVNSPYTGNVDGNIDPYTSYYMFILDSASDVTMTVNDLSKAQDITIEYYGTDSTFYYWSGWADDNDTDLNGESFTRSGLSAGTYYFAVYNYDYDAITYTVMVSNN